MQPRLPIAEVSQLPWPHLRFKCANADAFGDARDQSAVVAGLSAAALARC